MNQPAKSDLTICVIEDDVLLNELICGLLQDEGYGVQAYASATDFVRGNQERRWAIDLVISDISMPGLSGHELCKIIRSWPTPEYIPIVLITGSVHANGKAWALGIGADDLIAKPCRFTELLAKVRSLLGVRARQAETLSRLERSERESRQLEIQLYQEAQRATRFESLAHVLPPNVTQLLVSDSPRAILKHHRGEVTVLFIDLRRFTAFAEATDPDEVLGVLEGYYRLVGELVIRHKGTIGHLAGDGIMAFFNDPEPITNHREVATLMALEARASLNALREEWAGRGYHLDFGIGLAEGLATIGGIGFDQFWHYSVIGTVTNLASRICGLADNGQILMSRRFLSKLPQGNFRGELIGRKTLKGIAEPVELYNVLGCAGTVVQGVQNGRLSTGL